MPRLCFEPPPQFGRDRCEWIGATPQSLGLRLAMLVGRTSPSFQAVRSPERNCSKVGKEGFAVSPRAGLSRYQRAAAGAHGSPSAGELGPTWTAALALDGAPPRSCVGPPSTVDRVSLGGDSVS